MPRAGLFSPRRRTPVGLARRELQTALASSMFLIVTETTATMDCPLLQIQEVVELVHVKTLLAGLSETTLS